MPYPLLRGGFAIDFFWQDPFAFKESFAIVFGQHLKELWIRIGI